MNDEEDNEDDEAEHSDMEENELLKHKNLQTQLILIKLLLYTIVRQ